MERQGPCLGFVEGSMCGMGRASCPRDSWPYGSPHAALCRVTRRLRSVVTGVYHLPLSCGTTQSQFFYGIEPPRPGPPRAQGQGAGGRPGMYGCTLLFLVQVERRMCAGFTKPTDFLAQHHRYHSHPTLKSSHIYKSSSRSGVTAPLPSCDQSRPSACAYPPHQHLEGPPPLQHVLLSLVRLPPPAPEAMPPPPPLR